MLSIKSIRNVLGAFFLGCFLAQGAMGQSLDPAQDPLGEPEVQVKVERLKLNGNTQLGDDQFADILEGYQGRLLSFEDIRRIAEAVVTRYRENDFLTVSAYLPEQDLTDGEVTINVVEAEIASIEVEGAKFYDEDFVRWMFKPALKGQERGQLARRSDVQRQLLLLNDNMDLNVRSIIRESSEEGKVDLVLQVQDSRPLHFGFDYNNLGAESTGVHRLGTSFEWGNLSRRGDVLNLRYVESDLLNADTDGLDLFQVGYSAPLNNNGTYFDFSYANSAFQAGQEFQILDIRGEADVFRAAVRHKIIRSPESNLDITAGLTFQDIENSILGQQLSRDRLREFILGLSGDWVWGSGRNYGSIMLTQDLGEAFGGTSSNDPLSSRRAGGGFTKLKLDLSRVQKINEFSYMILRGSHQTAFSPLPFAEQFGLGGISSVRGFDQSAYLGDTGYNLSAEVRFAPIESNRQLFEVGAFIDHGGAAVKNPLPGEIPNATLTGAGVTFQFRLPEQTFIRADLAWPLAKSGIVNNDDGPIPYVVFSKRF